LASEVGARFRLAWQRNLGWMSEYRDQSAGAIALRTKRTPSRKRQDTSRADAQMIHPAFSYGVKSRRGKREDARHSSSRMSRQ
jgi:hypothetical protein